MKKIILIIIMLSILVGCETVVEEPTITWIETLDCSNAKIFTNGKDTITFYKEEYLDTTIQCNHIYIDTEKVFNGDVMKIYEYNYYSLKNYRDYSLHQKRDNWALDSVGFSRSYYYWRSQDTITSTPQYSYIPVKGTVYKIDSTITDTICYELKGCQNEN